MALVLNWQKKLGYREDPFQDVPFYAYCLVGLEKQREAINLFIIKGQQLGLVLGDKGTGKSTLLAWLKEEVRGKIKAIALEAKTIGSQERLETLLYDATSSFIEKHLIKDEKTKEERHKTLKERLQEPHVLLIDNAGSLTPPHITLLQELLNDTKLQVLLFDLPEKFKKVPFEQRPNLRVTLGNYIEDHFVEVLRCRIEKAGGLGTFPFDEKERRRVFSKADHNPRALLKFARERAIELSLKGLELPTKPKSQEGSVKKERKGFSLFGLRFVSKDEAEKLKKIQKKEEQGNPLITVVDKESGKESKAESKQLEKEEQAAISDEAKRQSEELERMLREAVGEEPKKEEKETRKEERKAHQDKHIHDDIIVSKR